MAHFIDLTGKRFGKLTVFRMETPGDKRSHAKWAVICDCGNMTVVDGSHLRRGNTVGCGCQRGGIKHRMYLTTEYSIWENMVSRCYNRSNDSFPRYGGRGIMVCNRWRDFRLFFKDMGARPSMGHSMDRIDNDGNYEPGNCRWATRKEQARNTRRNKYIHFDGKLKTLAAWSEEYRISSSVVNSRLRNGWDVERALTEPIHRGAIEPSDAAMNSPAGC